MSLFVACLIFLASAAASTRGEEKKNHQAPLAQSENRTSSLMDNEMTDSRNTEQPQRKIRERRVKRPRPFDDDDDDTAFSGSSFFHQHWSVASPDGWVGVPNPNLKIASESGVVARNGHQQWRRRAFTTQVKHLPPASTNEEFFRTLQIKSLEDHRNEENQSRPPWTSPYQQHSIDADYNEVDWRSNIVDDDQEMIFCSSDEMFAPTCFDENRGSDFHGCVEDERYPYRDIYRALMRDDLIFQKLSKDDTYASEEGHVRMSSGDYFDQDRVDYLGFVCPSNVELARPRRLLNVERQWRVIVNDGRNFQQTVRLETCRKALSPCRLMAPCFGSICVQKYAYHRLLSFDPCQPEKGLFIDIYRLPVACSCAIHQK